MPAAKRSRRDSLMQFYKLPAVPNNVLNDERRFGDRDFFEGLDLSYEPLKPVADALRLGNLEAAKAAVVKHFRTRRKPRITKYRTDPPTCSAATRSHAPTATSWTPTADRLHTVGSTGTSL
jgi:hypothetical protein